MYFQGHEQNFAGGIDKLLLAAQQIEVAPPSPPQPQNPTGKNGKIYWSEIIQNLSSEFD